MPMAYRMTPGMIAGIGGQTGREDKSDCDK